MGLFRGLIYFCVCPDRTQDTVPRIKRRQTKIPDSPLPLPQNLDFVFAKDFSELMLIDGEKLHNPHLRHRITPPTLSLH